MMRSLLTSSERVGTLTKVAQNAILTVLSVCALSGALFSGGVSAQSLQAQDIGKVAAVAQAQVLPKKIGAHAHLAASARQLQQLQEQSGRLYRLEQQEAALYAQESTVGFDIQKDGSQALQESRFETSQQEESLNKNLHTFITKTFVQQVYDFAMDLTQAGFYQNVPQDLQVSATVSAPNADKTLLLGYASLDFDRVEAPQIEFELPYASALHQAQSSLTFSAQRLSSSASKRVDLPDVPAQGERLDDPAGERLRLQSFVELTTLHELAHIEHGLRPHMFEHPALSPVANSIISTQMKHDFDATLQDQTVRLSSAQIIDSVGSLQKELYADVHMALSYLKLKGATPQALKDLKHFAAERAHNSAYETHKFAARHGTLSGHIDGYQTTDALQFVLDHASQLENMEPSAISQAASFIASSYTHALVAPLMKSGLPDGASNGVVRLNANVLQVMHDHSGQQLVGQQVDTGSLLEAIHAGSAVSTKSAFKSFSQKRAGFNQEYKQVNMSVQHFPTKSSLGM